MNAGLLFTDAVEVPVPVTVMWALDVDVETPGAYRTITVQLAPGLSATPDAQVPPVMENDPGPEFLLTAGAAVKV